MKAIRLTILIHDGFNMTFHESKLRTYEFEFLLNNNVIPNSTTLRRDCTESNK
jgi:hypothetical protein